MKEYNKLKKEIKGGWFYNDYKLLNWLLVALSYIGNLMSILFTFFYVFVIVIAELPVFPARDVIASIVLLCFLSLFEFMKRFSFHKLVLEVAKQKIGKSLSQLISALFVLSISGLSLYFASKGAEKVVDRNVDIEKQELISVKKIEDSLNIRFDKRIEELQKQSELVYTSVENRQNKSILLSDKKMLESIRADIAKIEEERVKTLNSIKEINQNQIEKKIRQNRNSQQTSFMFVVFVECLILCGVGFTAYYKLRSFTEYEKRLQTDPKLRNQETLLKLIKFLYVSTENKLNVFLPELEELKDIILEAEIVDSEKQIDKAINFLQYLKIISTRDERYIFIVEKNEAIEKIRQYYNSEESD